MDNDNLTCLIVGETPNTQFIAWRLSLANAFIILTSQSLSMDGLVGWKSTKLGANFYKANIFTKNVDELIERITVVKEDLTKTEVGERVSICKYDIDIIIISSISLDKFRETCHDLKKFANSNTIILVSADFGSELELIALKEFGDNCFCVMSILSDVECRQLSLGSYTLVNDNYCKIKIGISYLMKNFPYVKKAKKDKEKRINDLNKQLEKNFRVYQKICSDNGKSNKLNKFIEMLQLTPWIRIDKVLDPREMSLLIWENIIPKISLNLLTIIYEQFDYNKMLNVKSTNDIFQDLVLELLEISQIQNGFVIDKFIYRDKVNGKINENLKLTSEMINFDKIISICNSRREQLNKSTANEHPEYLSLPFETYCFYHRFEYPAQILLYQPLQLGQKYSINCSNLNFLYGVYSRLLSLTGLSIKGGHYQTKVQLFDKDLKLSLGNENEDRNIDEKIKLNQSRERRYHHTDDGLLDLNSNFTSININQPNGKNVAAGEDESDSNYMDASCLTPNLTTFNEISEMYNMYENAIGSHQSGTNNISVEDEREGKKTVPQNTKEPTDQKFSHNEIYVNPCDGDEEEDDDDNDDNDNIIIDDDSRASSFVSMGTIGIPQNHRLINNNKSKTKFGDGKRNGVFFENGISDKIRPNTTGRMQRDNSQENFKNNLELQLRNDFSLNFDQINIPNNGVSDLQLPRYQNFKLDTRPQSEEDKIKKQLSFARLNGKIWQQMNQTNIRNGIIPMPDQHYQNIDKYRKYDDLAKTISVLTRGNRSMNIIPYTTTRYGAMDLLQNFNVQNVKRKDYHMQQRLNRIRLKQIRDSSPNEEPAP